MLNRKLLNTIVNEENWSITRCWFLGAISMYDTQQARLPAAVREMSPRSSPGEDRESGGDRAQPRYMVLDSLFLGGCSLSLRMSAAPNHKQKCFHIRQNEMRWFSLCALEACLVNLELPSKLFICSDVLEELYSTYSSVTTSYLDLGPIESSRKWSS